jgi:ArsR family transcriptional regulator
MSSRLDEDAAMFKALSDPLRLRLLDLLPASGQKRHFCVCELADELGVSQPCLSHHLNILKNAGLVGFEKDGCSVFYFVDDASVVNRLQDFQARMEK